MGLVLPQLDARTVQHAEVLRWIARLAGNVLEPVLEVELTEVLGRDRHGRSGDGAGGSRNGFKTRSVRLPEDRWPVKLPQARNMGRPYQSHFWARLRRAKPSLREFVLAAHAKGLGFGMLRSLFSAIGLGDGSPLLSSERAQQRICDAFDGHRQWFAARRLDHVLPECLSVSTIQARRLDGSPRQWCIVSCGCLRGSGEVLDAFEADSAEPCWVGERLRCLKARGLSPPIDTRCGDCPMLQQTVSETWSTRERCQFWQGRMCDALSGLEPARRCAVGQAIRELAAS